MSPVGDGSKEVDYAVVKQQWRAVELALAAKLMNRDTPPAKSIGKNELAGLQEGIIVRAKEANLKGSFPPPHIYL